MSKAHMFVPSLALDLSCTVPLSCTYNNKGQDALPRFIAAVRSLRDELLLLYHNKEIRTDKTNKQTNNYKATSGSHFKPRRTKTAGHTLNHHSFTVLLQYFSSTDTVTVLLCLWSTNNVV